MASSGTAIGKGTFQPDSVVHITYEDQQKINKFARLNAKMDDFKDEIKLKENDLKILEDACDELALADDEDVLEVTGATPELSGKQYWQHSNIYIQICTVSFLKSVTDLTND